MTHADSIRFVVESQAQALEFYQPS